MLKLRIAAARSSYPGGGGGESPAGKDRTSETRNRGGGVAADGRREPGPGFELAWSLQQRISQLLNGESVEAPDQLLILKLFPSSHH